MEFGFFADTSALSAFAAALPAALDPAQSAPMRRAFVSAGGVYMEFTRRRYLSAAGGDGTWAPTAAQTTLNRSRASLTASRSQYRLAVRGAFGPRQTRIGTVMAAASGKSLILFKTGALYASLSSGGPNYYEEIVPGGIRVGTADPKAPLHQSGTARMPARTILVAPDDPTRQAIGDELAGGAAKAVAAAAKT